MKNKTTAALLALFLGGFGVHKFYLKDTGSGIFYIMLTVFSASLRFPIGWILGFIDALALFSMSEERFDKKYNSGTQQRGRSRSRRGERRESRTAGRNPYQNAEEADYRNARRSNRNSYREPVRKNKVIKDNPFKVSGIKRIKDFELDLAEADLIKAVELSPDDNEIHFELGKLFSMTEQKEKSFFHLVKAVQLGYKNVKDFREADELAYLRVQPEFEAFESSGYTAVPSGGSSPNVVKEKVSNAPVAPPADDLLQDDLLLSQLSKLQELRKKGLLSEAEFEEEKTKLIRR
jgi:TM2 domain-containing membrane protein YozV